MKLSWLLAGCLLSTLSVLAQTSKLNPEGPPVIKSHGNPFRVSLIRDTMYTEAAGHSTPVKSLGVLDSIMKNVPPNGPLHIEFEFEESRNEVINQVDSVLRLCKCRVEKHARVKRNN